MAEAFQNQAMAAEALDNEECDDLFSPKFTQSAHGFTGPTTALTVVRRSSATAHARAQADTEANVGLGLGLVVNVPNVNTFQLLRWGNHHAVTATAHGLGAFGADIYLSATVAGEVTATASAVRVGFVIDANTIMWEPGFLASEF